MTNLIAAARQEPNADAACVRRPVTGTTAERTKGTRASDANGTDALLSPHRKHHHVGDLGPAARGMR
jgi:hypothetical protein